MNYRKCTEDQIVKEVAKKIEEIGRQIGFDEDFEADDEKLTSIAIKVADELIENELFYDYAEKDNGEFVYCFSLPGETIDEKLLKSKMTKKDTDTFEDMIKKELIAIALNDAFSAIF